MLCDVRRRKLLEEVGSGEKKEMQKRIGQRR